MEVAASVLVEGLCFSLTNCGRLLSDASVLYEAGREQTAAGIAMLAREELGKYRILLRLWQESATLNKRPTVAEVRFACEDHTEKQRKGMLSWSINAQAGSAIDGAIRTQMSPSATVVARQQAEEVMQVAFKAFAKRTPEDRHNTRMRALYVDLDDSGRTWNRPEQISREEAKKLLNDAVNDYANQYEKLDPDRLRVFAVGKDFDERLADEKLADALEAWPDRPIPPAPVWLEQF